MRPRARPSPAAPATGRIPSSTPWTDLVTDDHDLDDIAARLRRFARITRIEAPVNGPLPELANQPAADIDAIDAWLTAFDAEPDPLVYTGTRDWCWSMTLAPDF
jgi:hypothetical protein